MTRFSDRRHAEQSTFGVGLASRIRRAAGAEFGMIVAWLRFVSDRGVETLMRYGIRPASTLQRGQPGLLVEPERRSSRRQERPGARVGIRLPDAIGEIAGKCGGRAVSPAPLVDDAETPEPRSGPLPLSGYQRRLAPRKAAGRRGRFLTGN
jgi:hypothetical protein